MIAGQDVPVIDEYASMELATGIDGDGVVHAGVANDAIPKAKPTESEAMDAQGEYMLAVLMLLGCAFVGQWCWTLDACICLNSA